MKKLIRDAAIYFVLSLGCTLGADYIHNQVWHDSLLLIAGVLLGVFCAIIAVIDRTLRMTKATTIGDETKIQADQK